MELTPPDWRSTIEKWLVHYDYTLATDRIIDMIADRLVKSGGDFRAIEEEFDQSGRMTREQKRVSWDAFLYVLCMERAPRWKHRSHEVTGIDIDPAAAEINADPALQSHQATLVQDLKDAIQSLPRWNKYLIKKRYYDEATYREIAHQSGKSLGLVHKDHEQTITMLADALAVARRQKRSG